MNRPFTLAAGAVLLCALGCGGNSATPTNPAPTPDLNAIVSIKIEGIPSTLTAGETHQLKVVATLAGGTTLDVTGKALFKTTNAAVATISAGGVLTLLSGGDCGLTALVDSVSANVNAHVRAREAISRLEIRGKVDVLMGERSQLRVIGFLDTGAEVDLTHKAIITSSNEAVVKFVGTGTIEGVDTGSCDLDSIVDGIRAKVKASVKRGDIIGLDLLSKIDLLVGDITDVKVLARLSGGAKIDVTAHAALSTSNSSILKVNANALIEAANPGACDLIAVFEGVRASVRLNVKDKSFLSIVKIRIEGKLTLKIGEIAQLKAIAEMSDNTEVDVTARATWTTSNSSCCLINLLGVITALVPGECLLTGMVDGVTTSVPVKVTLL